MKLILTTLSFFFLSITTYAQWTQVGQSIYGDISHSPAGKHVSMNSDGSIIAVSKENSVEVYQNVSGNWIQLGNSVNIEYVSSLALSDDGTTIALGWIGSDDVGPDYGNAKVFRYNSGTWEQIGNDFWGAEEDASLGQAIGLSYDGTIMAVSSTFPYDNSGYYGKVSIYQNISNNWVQIGSEIVGDDVSDCFGYCLSIDSIGSTVVIGAIYSSEAGIYSGKVKVFENISNSWTQIGSNLLGEAPNNKFGYSVSISNDASVIALGEKYNNAGTTNEAGQVRIYRNVSGSWAQIGNTLVGDNTDDLFGNSVSLNSNGSVLVIGAPKYDLKGQVKVFKNVSNIWTQIRLDLYGEYDGNNLGEYFGASVDISNDGYTIVIGHPYNDELFLNNGKISVFTYSCDDINNYDLIEEDTICPAENMVLDAGFGFDSYLWNTGAQTQNTTVADSGYYKVVVSGFECGMATDSVHLTRGTTPTINLISDTSICQNTSILLDAGSPYSSYLWNTGETSQTVTVSTSGYYSVSVTAFSCSNSDGVNIGINELPNIELFDDTLTCPYDTITIDAGIGYLYLWSNGEETQSIQANAEGLYTVTVSNSYNCTKADSVYISHSINATGVEDTIEICVNGAITISANPINNNTWNSIQNTDTINYLFVNDTTFFLEAIDTMLCVINDTIFLKVDSNFVVPTGIDDTILTCYNNELTLFCNPENENIWNSVLHSDSITYLAANDTIFYLDVTSPIGCQYTDTIFIDQDSSLNFIFDNTYLSSDTIMLGDTLWLYGNESTNSEFTTFTKNPGVFLPDGVGLDFIDIMTINSNGTIDNLDKIQNITLNMEHSYAGDLSINLVCPNEQTMEILTYPTGLSNHFLGEPVDDDNSNTFGVGYDYVFKPEASLTFQDVADQNSYTYIDNDGTEYTNQRYIPEGEYAPNSNFSNLIGCPINGEWKISVQDHMGSDNGAIFSWSISVYGSSPTEWVGENIDDINNDTTYAVPITMGWHDYTYFVQNEYGCLFDTTIAVYVDGNVKINKVEANPKTWVIYPNPAHDFVVIASEAWQSQTALVELYNMQGQLVKQIVKSSKEKTSVKIQISDLPKGIYIVKIGEKTQKLIVESKN